MKVRISNNKIRFRLKEPEVEKFHQTGVITEALQFSADESEQVKFTLRVYNSNEITAAFHFNETTILIPKHKAEQWATTELVGFEAEADTGKGRKIYVLVEKDFMCMDGREEDNEGSYANPLAKTKIANIN